MCSTKHKEILAPVYNNIIWKVLQNSLKDGKKNAFQVKKTTISNTI